MSILKYSRSLVTQAALAAALACPAAVYAGEQQIRFQIPAGSMSKALRAYSQQSGQKILYTESIVANLRGGAVNGSFHPDDALAQLLKGSRIKVERTKHGVVILRSPSASLGADQNNSQAPAQATHYTASAAAATSGSNGLGEIVVTAQKRNENLQDTPLSVSVIGGDDLTRNGIYDIRELGSVVPNIQITPGTNTLVTIRGIGINASPVQTDQAVSVNVDGVYMARANSINGAFFDIERIEVLRGPQGTLYGRNSTAGALNIFTAKPKFEYAGSAEVEFGNLDKLRFSGMLNAPVSDQIAVRASFQSDRRDGYMSNGANAVDSTAARMHVLLEPTENLSVLLSGDYLDLGGDGGGLMPLPSAGGDWYTPFDQTGAKRDTKQSGLQTEVNWTLGDVTVTYIGARRKIRNDIVLKAGFTLAEQSADRVWTHELRVGGGSDASTLQWLLGLYALDQDGQFAQQIQSGPFQSFASNPDQAANSKAVFGQATLKLIDSLRLTGGLRFSKDKKSQTGFDTYGDPFLNEGSWNSTNWRIALEAHASENSLLYASASTGFRAGGFFGGAPPNTFRPEELTAYAIGSKNTFAGGKVRLNAEAFYYDYKDLQIGYLDYVNPFPAFGNRINNVGRAEVYGVEIDGNWQVLNDARLDASVSYLHARYKDFVVPGSDYPPPNGRPPVDYSGQVMTRSPAWSGRIAYNHSFYFPDGNKLTATVAAYGSTGQWLDFIHIPESRQRAYAKADMSLTYDFVDNGLSVTGYLRNITNQAVWNSYTNSGGSQVQVGPPRTYGVMMNARF